MQLKGKVDFISRTPTSRCSKQHLARFSSGTMKYTIACPKPKCRPDRPEPSKTIFSRSLLLPALHCLQVPTTYILGKIWGGFRLQHKNRRKSATATTISSGHILQFGLVLPAVKCHATGCYKNGGDVRFVAEVPLRSLALTKRQSCASSM